MKAKKITIECTEKQALLIEQCLEYCARIGAGQLHHINNIIDLCSNKSRTVILPTGEEAGWYKLGMWIQETIKPILFPELRPNASYGVGNKEIPNGQIMYEIYKKLQNFRMRDGIDDCGVLKDEPLHYSKEPLINVYEKE